MVLPNKAVIIGLDGATWTLLRPWIDQGQLPNLARLVQEGASGPLTTTIPPVSASAWVSFATGCNPGKHGAFDFVFPQPGGYDIGVINVQVRGVPPFWKTIEEAGGQVGLMSVPITYPPQPIHGFTVNGFLVPNEQSAYTYPPELKEELKREGQRWPLHEFEGNRSRHPGRFLQDMLDFDVTRTNTIIWMMQHKPWDLLACVLKTPDTVHHEVWHIIDPTHPRYDAELNRQFAPAVLDYFKKIDDCVGRIIAAAPPDTFVAIMSDHGGGPFHKFFHVNNWLAQQGLLKFKRTPLSLFKRALFKLGFTPITSLKIVNFFKTGTLAAAGETRARARHVEAPVPVLRRCRLDAHQGLCRRQLRADLHQREGAARAGHVEPGAEYEAVREQIIRVGFGAARSRRRRSSDRAGLQERRTLSRRSRAAGARSDPAHRSIQIRLVRPRRLRFQQDSGAEHRPDRASHHGWHRGAARAGRQRRAKRSRATSSTSRPRCCMRWACRCRRSWMARCCRPAFTPEYLAAHPITRAVEFRPRRSPRRPKPIPKKMKNR